MCYFAVRLGLIVADLYHSKVLRPANDAVQKHSYFRRKLGWVSDKNHMNAKIPDTKAALEQQIKDYGQDLNSFSELKNQAVDNVIKASDLHETYQTDRTHGGKKFGRSAQNFVNRFAEFLSVYSGIVELLKGAGDIYGQVAYETLSIFFIVRSFSRLLWATHVLNELGRRKQDRQRLQDCAPSPRTTKVFPTAGRLGRYLPYPINQGIGCRGIHAGYHFCEAYFGVLYPFLE